MNIGINTQCKLCKGRGIVRSYEGESSGNLYLQKQHFKVVGNKKKEKYNVKLNQENSNNRDNVDFNGKIKHNHLRRPFKES